jgi:hypothetical protein
VHIKNNSNTTYLLAIEGFGGVDNFWYNGVQQTSLPFAFTEMRVDFAWDSNDSHFLCAVSQTPTTGTWQGPGSVPVGGMVAVMPNIDTTNAWQPPASGVIKDGFMRADGTTITQAHVNAGTRLVVGTVLPNMVGKYPRGNTTSGTTGGANTQESNVAATWPSYSVDGHSHGAGSYGAMVAFYGSMLRYNRIEPGVWTSSYKVAIAGESNSPESVNPGLMVQIAGSSSYATSTTTRSGGSLTNNAVNNEPAYVETVWVIRVL